MSRDVCEKLDFSMAKIAGIDTSSTFLVIHVQAACGCVGNSDR